ncbi:hypothetical protein [Micromonospora craniellae]|uniref:hypothetical protein n=1 Tax=Micromonospora craniellae TaxID=2294034 RepID=UPI001CC463BA|nr:hypothetical protein [Micromonospora craniellae]
MSGLPDAWGTPQYHLLVSVCGQAEAHHDTYERTGSLRDLEFAIAVITEVLKVARNVDIRSTAANGLGTARWSRYERFGDLADLDTAIGLFREALAMYPNERTPATPSFHANLGGVLRLRWRGTGIEADLVESVAQVRAALAATGPTHPRRAARLTNLADGLLTLSLRYDDSSALAEAVEVSREAVAAAGPGDDLAGMLSNLAGMLRLRYRSTARTGTRWPGTGMRCWPRSGASTVSPGSCARLRSTTCSPRSPGAGPSWCSTSVGCGATPWCWPGAGSRWCRCGWISTRWSTGPGGCGRPSPAVRVRVCPPSSARRPGPRSPGRWSGSGTPSPSRCSTRSPRRPVPGCGGCRPGR